MGQVLQMRWWLAYVMDPTSARGDPSSCAYLAMATYTQVLGTQIHFNSKGLYVLRPTQICPLAPITALMRHLRPY